MNEEYKLIKAEERLENPNKTKFGIDQKYILFGVIIGVIIYFMS